MKESLTYLYHLWTDVTQLINFMHQFVDIDAIIVSWHFVVTVTAGIQQYFVLLKIVIRFIVVTHGYYNPKVLSLRNACVCCTIKDRNSSHLYTSLRKPEILDISCAVIIS